MMKEFFARFFRSSLETAPPTAAPSFHEKPRVDVRSRHFAGRATRGVVRAPRWRR